MKSFLRIIFLISICLTSHAFAQTPVTITGTITDSGGNVVTSGTVEFDVQPQSSSIQYYVPNITAVAPQAVVCNIGAGGALFNQTGGACTVWGNDVIAPANTTYTVTFSPNGQQTNSVAQEFISGSTYNIDNPVFAPIVSIIPQYSSITAPPIQGNLVPTVNGTFTIGNAQAYYSTIYVHNIVGLSLVNGNFYGTFTGTLYGNASTATALQNTPSLCASGEFAQGILADGDATGCASGTSPVTSVFGRTGAIVAQTGDYNFSQISGTVANSQLANNSITLGTTSVVLGSTISGAAGFNAATASALAAAPAQCSSGQFATGITVAGAANCSAPPSGTLTIIGHKGSASCVPAGDSYTVCDDTITWQSAFPDTNYLATCSLESPITSPSGGSTSMLVYPHAPVSTTTLGVSVQANTSAGDLYAADIICIGQEL